MEDSLRDAYLFTSPVAAPGELADALLSSLSVNGSTHWDAASRTLRVAEPAEEHAECQRCPRTDARILLKMFEYAGDAAASVRDAVTQVRLVTGVDSVDTLVLALPTRDLGVQPDAACAAYVQRTWGAARGAVHGATLGIADASPVALRAIFKDDAPSIVSVRQRDGLCGPSDLRSWCEAHGARLVPHNEALGAHPCAGVLTRRSPSAVRAGCAGWHAATRTRRAPRARLGRQGATVRGALTQYTVLLPDRGVVALQGCVG